jgi:hypothetical protein
MTAGFCRHAEHPLKTPSHSKSKSSIARLSLLFLVLAHQTETGPRKHADQRDDLHLTESEDQALRSNVTA